MGAAEADACVEVSETADERVADMRAELGGTLYLGVGISRAGVLVFMDAGAACAPA